jgi:hypothetical protein
VASGTSRIWWALAGIMLLNHSPLVIAEQARAHWESLYPGRISTLAWPRAWPVTKSQLRALRQ